jgi:betaine reductase
MKDLFEKDGNENLVVILGSPSADSAELYAETVVNGDPTWAGPLAGVAMKLPVFHVLEPEIKQQIDPDLYKKHLAIMEMALDVDKISEVLGKIRASMQ